MIITNIIRSFICNLRQTEFNILNHTWPEKGDYDRNYNHAYTTPQLHVQCHQYINRTEHWQNSNTLACLGH